MEQSNLLRLKGLIARGHTVRQVSLNPIGGLGPLLEQAGIPSIGLDYQSTSKMSSLRAMWREFRREPCDAVVVTGHNWSAALALSGLPVRSRILCIHHYHFDNGRAAHHWPLFYRMAARRFDAVTFCSQFIRDEALRLYPGLEAKSRVLVNPFELPDVWGAEARAAARQRLGLPQEGPIVGNAGWLIPRKRFDLFLAVAQEVLRHAPETLFLIAGDGPERGRLEASAAAAGICDRVSFLGWQSDMEVVLASLNVLLFNSDHDALGRTPVEAAAHGVAVVASVRAGGLREILDEASGAVVLDDHDVPRLAQEVLRLVRDPALATEHGRTAREHVADRCSVARHTAIMERLLAVT